MLNSLIQKYDRILIINEVTYIGDSIVFFWPLVNALVSAYPDKEISVFHHHSNLFKPSNDKIQNRPLTGFNDEIKADETTLVIAFIKSDGQLKEYLKCNGFQSIVKGMVGLDITTFNLADIGVVLHEYERLPIDSKEIKYLHTNLERDSQSGFPLLKQSFSNVYQYAKICNESFLSLNGIDTAFEENIVMHELDKIETFTDLFISSSPVEQRNYILINFISSSLKKDVQENYTNLLCWIRETVVVAKKKNLDVWLLVDNKFPNLRNDLHESHLNLFFLKEQTSLYWTTLMKKAEKIYSIDTGFLHIAHVLNENTFGFGGDVDFWFFKDKTIDI